MKEQEALQALRDLGFSITITSNEDGWECEAEHDDYPETITSNHSVFEKAISILLKNVQEHCMSNNDARLNKWIDREYTVTIQGGRSPNGKWSCTIRIPSTGTRSLVWCVNKGTSLSGIVAVEYVIGQSDDREFAIYQALQKAKVEWGGK